VILISCSELASIGIGIEVLGNILFQPATRSQSAPSSLLCDVRYLPLKFLLLLSRSWY
jgi:hypothetical protein